MNAAWIRPPGADAAAGSGRPGPRADRMRDAAYAAVALAGLVVGFLLGLLCAGDPYGSRGAPAGPDSTLPHPRSIER